MKNLKKDMKSLLFMVCCFILYSSTLFAQGDFEPYNAGWLNQIDLAYQKSLSTGKPIFALYGCVDCKDLRSFITSDEFYAWAESNVVLLEIYPYRYSKLTDEQKLPYQSLMSIVKLRSFEQAVICIPQLNKPKDQFQVDHIGKLNYFTSVKDLDEKFKEMLSIAQLTK